MPARPLESKKPPRGGYPWAAMPVNEHLESIIIIPHENLEGKGEMYETGAPRLLGGAARLSAV